MLRAPPHDRQHDDQRLAHEQQQAGDAAGLQEVAERLIDSSANSTPTNARASRSPRSRAESGASVDLQPAGALASL